LLSYCN